MPLTLGKAIKVIREAKRFSLTQLATQAKISKPYLCLIESDARSPSLGVMERLGAALGVPTDVLIMCASRGKGTLVSSDQSADRLMTLFERLTDVERELRDCLKNR
ncbi:MAG: helix-turn-helix transcriptional regulator [Phycisphaerae bacterium]|nr:helix-turn-helix transcriptional regulator [Phycisphaerae bacterium]